MILFHFDNDIVFKSSDPIWRYISIKKIFRFVSVTKEKLIKYLVAKNKFEFESPIICSVISFCNCLNFTKEGGEVLFFWENISHWPWFPCIHISKSKQLVYFNLFAKMSTTKDNNFYNPSCWEGPKIKLPFLEGSSSCQKKTLPISSVSHLWPVQHFWRKTHKIHCLWYILTALFCLFFT